ncbi:MAG: DUF5047 domain-containing protein [Actinomycetota bacterium]
MTVAEFADVVSGSHVAKFDARVVEEYAEGDDPDGTDIGIETGEVGFDGTAKVRGTLSLTTPGRDGQDGPMLWPKGQTRLLSPLHGHEVFVRRGVDLGGAGTLWSPLGYYRIHGAGQDEAPDGLISLECSDRMRAIVKGRLTQPRAYSSGTTVGDVVEDLVLDIYPDATIVWDDDSDEAALGRQLVAERERYDALKNVVDSLGKIAYWDDEGQLRIEDAPDEDDPVWTVTHGEDGVLLDTARTMSDEGVYNGVVAEGEGGDTEDPVRAVAVDDNPHSPTRWGGSFGKVPRFFSSQYITTESQAQNAARQILRRSLGAPYSLSFGAVPNPALRPYDPVRVRFVTGASETHIAEKLTIPLSAETEMTAETREKAVIVIGAG